MLSNIVATSHRCVLRIWNRARRQNELIFSILNYNCMASGCSVRQHRSKRRPCWCVGGTLVIPALGKQRQEDQEFEAKQQYIRPWQNKQTNKTNSNLTNQHSSLELGFFFFFFGLRKASIKYLNSSRIANHGQARSSTKMESHQFDP